MTSAVSDLIPAHRFGPLLAEARASRGLDLAVLAHRSAGHFTEGELSAFETGRDAVRDDLLPLISQLYGVDCRQVVPHRAKLCLDISSKYLRVGETKENLSRVDYHHVLDRYLSLVYMLRNVEPGTEIPLRSHDLAILEASLLERSELIEEQLLAAMAANDPELSSLLAKLKKKLWIPGAGILVGAVTVGALVFASQADPEPDDDRAAGGGAGAAAPATLVVDNVDVQASAPLLLASTIATAEAAAVADFTTISAEQVLGQQALDLVGLDLETVFPGWSVEFYSAIDGYRGLTFADEQRIEVYVQANDTPSELAGIVAHELGHAFDLTYLDDSERLEWMDSRGIDTQWWVGNGVSDFEAGQGDFAEGFAAYLTGDHIHHDSAGPMTAAQQALLVEIITPHLG